MQPQQITLLGFGVVIAGILLIIAGALFSSGKEQSSMAVGGFIGPIPFGFMNTPWGWAIGGFLFVALLLWSLLRNG